MARGAKPVAGVAVKSNKRPQNNTMIKFKMDSSIARAQLENEDREQTCDGQPAGKGCSVSATCFCPAVGACLFLLVAKEMLCEGPRQCHGLTSGNLENHYQ